MRVEDSIIKDVLEMLLKGEIQLERDREAKCQGSLKIVRGASSKKNSRLKRLYG